MKQAAAILVACGFVYYQGDKRRPVGVAVGNALSGESKHAPTNGLTIRIATLSLTMTMSFSRQPVLSKARVLRNHKFSPITNSLTTG